MATVTLLAILAIVMENVHWGCAKTKGYEEGCDIGTWHLEVDMPKHNEDFLYKCVSGEKDLPRKKNIRKILEEDLPLTEQEHLCMNVTIDYKKRYGTHIPTSGSHRPVWPTYGEYEYLPPTRYMHALEHGAIVALYHPCANPRMVNAFKSFVRNCLRQHLITPFGRLNPLRPFALSAWNNRIQLNTPDKREIVNFIRNHARKGPEGTTKNGNYTYTLIHKAEVVSDDLDTILCPNDRQYD